MNVCFIKTVCLRPEKNILDIGAGTGEFLKVCKVNLWNVFGTEPDMRQEM